MTSPIPTDLVQPPVERQTCACGREPINAAGICATCGDDIADLPLRERLAVPIGDRLGGFLGIGNHYRIGGDVRWKQSIEIAQAVLEATGVEHLQSQLTSMREALEPTDANVERLAKLNPLYQTDWGSHIALNIRMHVRAILAALKTMEQGDE